MQYEKIEEYKVACIAEPEDFELFGITIEDILNRTQDGFHFLHKIKELAGVNQKIDWTNTAHTLQINMLSEGRVLIVFSETIADYLVSLRQSMKMMSEENKMAMQQLIDALENAEPDTARKMIRLFEQNIRNV